MSDMRVIFELSYSACLNTILCKKDLGLSYVRSSIIPTYNMHCIKSILPQWEKKIELFANRPKNDGGLSCVDTHLLAAEEPPVQLILVFC